MRPLSEDAVYARELGWMHKRSYKRVRALGGAAKLRAMDESEREVLMHPKGKSTPKSSLAKLGMVSRVAAHSITKEAV